MKKIILIICVIFIFIEISAQEHFIKSPKSLSVKAIGTSANSYTALYPASKWLDFDPISNTIIFSHRQGGEWGGLSSNLYCKFSNNFGMTWDSIEYVYNSVNMFRNPNIIIYNSFNFTNTDSLYSIICGPTSNGINWSSNYFGSQRLSSSNLNMNYLPQLSSDTVLLTRINLCKGNDRFHIAGQVLVNNTGENIKYEIFNGIFNQTYNKVDWTSSEIITLFRKRTFIDKSINWDANPNLAFDNLGLHGFFFTFGADSLIDPYHTSIPVVWETTDGGLTWIKQIYNHFDKISTIRKKIYPTFSSYSNPDTLQWVYRPDFKCGTNKDELNFPGTVDALGNLHIATVVEGRISSHVDSLNFYYSNHPHLLFDLIKSDTGWNAIFIDTIKTDIHINTLISNKSLIYSDYILDHWIRIAKSPDGSKIFVLWTDTSNDTINVSPEIKAWGYDVVNNLQTLPTFFSTGNGNIMCLQVPNLVLVDGTTYKIPCTYLDPNSSQDNIAYPVKHYFLDGVEFNESDFIPVNVTKENQSELIFNVYPNPFSNQIQINYKLSKTIELSIEIYNAIGEKIETVFHGKQNEGIYNELLNLKVVGMYFIKFTANNEITYSKIIKIK